MIIIFLQKQFSTCKDTTKIQLKRKYPKKNEE